VTPQRYDTYQGSLEDGYPIMIEASKGNGDWLRAEDFDAMVVERDRLAEALRGLALAIHGMDPVAVRRALTAADAALALVSVAKP